MSLGPIQFGGLASGLDTNAIISALLQVEAIPIANLQSQRGVENSKLNLFGALEGLVETLQEKASALAGTGSFYDYTVTAADEGVATFTLSGTAATGSHSLKVNSLASADRHTFTALSDADADQGAGTVSFDYDGTSYSIDIDADSSSLNDIASAINSEAGDDVSASVINVGTDNSPSYQLVIAGDDTGADYTVDSLSTTISSLGAASEISAASNAEVEVDGLTVERSTNVFSDVVAGVSFTVTQADTNLTTSFNVDVDTEGTKENLQEVIDAYNAVIGFINKQSDYSEEGGPGGDLFGDSSLSSIRSSIHSALFDVDVATVQADTEGFSTLGLVGIDLDADGTLSIDDTVFDAKFAENADAIVSLFTDDDTGVLVQLDDAISELVDSQDGANGTTVDGLFDRRKDTINRIIEGIDSEVERMERNLEKLEETLVLRFANLESVISGLNSQSAYLSQGLAFPSAG